MHSKSPAGNSFLVLEVKTEVPGIVGGGPDIDRREPGVMAAR